MGFGDVRLAALLGLALGHVGWAELLVGVYSGFLVFGLPGLLLALVRWDRALLRTAFPFGPFMLVGALLGAAGRAVGGRLSRLRLTRAAGPEGHGTLAPMLRWLTAGESHGPSLVAILEGLPAHVAITSDDLVDALARRRLGYGRGARMKFEQDEVTMVGGVRHGRTQGGPVAIQIGNTEWPKWEKVMSADPVDPVELEALARNAALTRPRPGHADLVGMQKYAFDEARPVLERASARETAARVALGRVATNFLEQAVGARVVSHVVELGGVPAPSGVVPGPDDVERLDADPVRCLDPEASAEMVARIDQAHEDGDTLGGVVEVVVHGLPPGLGSHVHWDRRLDSRLAGALMGIQAIKGVEVGDGFELAATPGSRGPRRDRADRGGPAAYVGALGRHRGRDVDRRGAPGPGGDEADRHRAAGAAHRRRRHRRGDHRPPPALRRVRRAGRRHRRRGDGGAGAGRRGASRSSAATRSWRPGATPSPTSTR